MTIFLNFKRYGHLALAAALICAGSGPIHGQSPAPQSPAPQSPAPRGQPQHNQPPQSARTQIERAQIEQIMREYLLANPEILAEMVEALKAKQAARQTANSAQVLSTRHDEIYRDKSAPEAGNPTGDVAVVEFVDLRCPVCKRTYPVVKKLVASDGRIRKIYKLWPILGPESVYGARLALAAHRQGKFHAMLDAAMTHRGQATPNDMMDFALRAGANRAQLEADMKSPDIDQALRRNFALAEALGIDGTPAFIIGERVVVGGQNIDAFKQLVAEARRQ